MRAVWWLTVCVGCAPGPTVDPDDTDAPVDGDGVFRMAFMADPHVIGDDYVCCESPGVDTESIYRTRQRLETARDMVNDIDPPPKKVFILGDLFHQNYKWETLEDYETNPSAARTAKRILDGFEMPVELLWGNHDYHVPEFSRDFAHGLFRRMFDTEPYHAVDYGGWRFLMTNSQLGPTWDARDPMNAFFDTGWGSFGAEQLAWIAAQLDEGKPTILMFHHPPLRIERDEDPDGPFTDMFDLVEQYRDVIKGIYVGHTHIWLNVENYFDLPAYVMGSVRYDADNFWVFEFQEDGSGVEVVDFGKAQLASQHAYGATYTEGDVRIDFLTAAEEDPAGPWDEDAPGPDNWPPAE